MASGTCPAYLANPNSSVLGSGPVAVLTDGEADALLGFAVFLQHARNSVKDGQFAIRRGPGLTVFSDCSVHYVLIPGFAGTQPFAIPAAIAVAARVLDPMVYERLVGTQRATDERLRHLTGTLKAQARAMAIHRKEIIAELASMGPNGFLDLLADEAKALAQKAKDAAMDFAAWVPWIIGGVLVLVLVIRG